MIWHTFSSISLKSKDGFGREKKLEEQSAFFAATTRKIKAGKRDKVLLYIELGGGVEDGPRNNLVLSSFVVHFSMFHLIVCRITYRTQ